MSTIQRVLAHVLGECADVTGERVADEIDEEPDAHHQRAEAKRRELGDHREPDRADAKLAGRVEEIGEHEPDHARLHVAARLHLEHGDDEKHEAERHLREAEVHLDRRRRILSAGAELAPEHRKRDAEQHDEERVQRLEPSGRYREASCLPVRVLFREEVHQAAGLLERRPEDHDEREDHEDDAQAIPFDGSQRNLRAARHAERALRGRLAADVADIALREGELDDHREQHADAGREEADTPAVGRVLAERRADERREEGAGVDAHVEDRECAVTARIALRIEVADHRRDVRLEEPVAQDQEQEADVEARRRVGEFDAERAERERARHAEEIERRRERELSGSHHEAADDHGLALAEEVVGEPAAKDGCQVDEPRVPPVQLECL